MIQPKLSSLLSVVTMLSAVMLYAPTARAQSADSIKAARRAAACARCAEWNTPQVPFRIFGNAYFVGPNGLSALLLKSNNGLILLDAALPESAPLIAANIATLGFNVHDIKYIVNSHDHFDHAGGIADMQKASGAKVASSALSAPVLRRGHSEKDDPQFGLLNAFPPVSNIVIVRDGEAIKVGDITLTPHFTPGHTPGGTSWTWKSCEGTHCIDLVYADSQTAVSADNFLFTHNTTYPNAIKDFEHSFSVLEMLPCDVLITPHPDASNFWQRVAARDAGNPNALIDTGACKRYAAAARERLARRVAAELGK